MQIRASAFEGESVSVTDLLADSLALTGSATLDGLTAQGNVGCDQLLCNDVNCTDVFTATGTVAGATLSSTGAVSGSSLSISGAASVGLLSSATGITGSTLTINNTANAGNFTTVGDVSTGTLTASGAATAASFAATGALTGRHADDHRGGLRGPAGLREPGLHLHGHERRSVDGKGVCGDARSSGMVSAPQLFASNTLTVTNTSDFSDDLFLTKNWAGWSKLQVSNNSAAPDSGPELRLLGNQSARVFLERDGGAHQCELIMINDEALVQTNNLLSAVPHHEPQEPRLPDNPTQHGQRGLQHELHEFVGQPGEDGDGRGRRGGAPAALRLRGGQAVQAPGHERGPEAGLCLKRLRRNKVEEFEWSDGTEMVLSTISPHQRAVGGVQGLPGPAGRGGSLAGPAGAEERVEKKRSSGLEEP